MLSWPKVSHFYFKAWSYWTLDLGCLVHLSGWSIRVVFCYKLVLLMLKVFLLFFRLFFCDKLALLLLELVFFVCFFCDKLVLLMLKVFLLFFRLFFCDKLALLLLAVKILVTGSRLCNVIVRRDTVDFHLRRNISYIWDNQDGQHLFHFAIPTQKQ